MTNENESSTLSDHPVTNVIGIPVTADKQPIIWDGNDAHIEGNLYEVGRYYKRVGLFQALFKHHAAPLSNGRLAVDSASSAYFVYGKINDPRDFEDPCPPTAQRLADEFNAARTTAGKSVAPALSAVPPAFTNQIVISEHTVETENSKLLTSLTHVFGSAEPSYRAGVGSTHPGGSTGPKLPTLAP